MRGSPWDCGTLAGRGRGQWKGEGGGAGDGNAGKWAAAVPTHRCRSADVRQSAAATSAEQLRAPLSFKTDDLEPTATHNDTLINMRLYHCTSRSNGRKIRENGFRCGPSGLAGGGIYFAETAQDASRKAHANGIVLVCDVTLGRVYDVGHAGDSSLNLDRLNNAGYDSVRIARAGAEYCVYESSRVRVVGECNDPSEDAGRSYATSSSSSHQSDPIVREIQQKSGGHPVLAIFLAMQMANRGNW